MMRTIFGTPARQHASLAPGSPPLGNGEWVTVVSRYRQLLPQQLHWNEAYCFWDFSRPGETAIGFLTGAEGVDWARGRVDEASEEGRALLAAWALAQ